MYSIKDNIKWIIHFVKYKKWNYALGFVLIVLEILAELLRTGVQRWIIDDGFINGQFEKLPLLLILFGVSSIASPALFMCVAMVHHHIGFELRVKLAGILMKKVYKIPMKIFQNERVTRFVSYFTLDVNNVCQQASYRAPVGIQSILKAAALMVIVFYVNPLLLLTVTALSTGYIILGKYFSKRVRTISREVKERHTDLLIHIEEGISSTREVIAYNREKWEMKIYNKLFKKFFDKVMEEGKVENKQIFLTGPLRWGTSLAVLVFGGYNTIKGNISIGTFFILYQYTSQLVESYQTIYSIYISVSRAMSSLDRLRKVLDYETQNENTCKLSSKIKSIEIKDVIFRYQQNSLNVLDKISFSIQSGKKTAIVGPSGSGKSTISKLFIRFYDPVSGSIFVNGTDLCKVSYKEWMKKVSITFQDPYLFPDTLKNNILFGCENISDQHLMDMCKLVQIHDYIMTLPEGYETVIGERGITLSGGQRQRVALARSLIRNPEILILDEATSSLDLKTEHIIQTELDKLRSGKTTVIIAHRLSTVQNADIIYVVNNGIIVESGNHKELMSRPTLYRDLTYAQSNQI